MSGNEVDVSSEASVKIAEGNVHFTTSVYKVISSKEGNIFISPLSVEVILALVYMGAAGRTAEQIASALYLPTDREDVKAGFRALLDSLKSTENMTLEVANKVFSQNKYKILTEFKAVAEKSFLSGAQELNFGDDEVSRNIINSWVEEKTRNKIKDLIPSGLLNALTRLVLVNAVYFKGLWKKQFDASNTRPEKFHLNSKENKEIPMMHKTANFGYLESDELDAAILEMPYQGQNISMFVVLPNDIDGISNLEEKLAGADLSTILRHLPTREVKVTMPKFKLEESTDFNDILEKLGMTSMFSADEADFSGISGNRDLYVSNVLHKAFIEVNEEGSEAAAATAGVIRMKRSLMAREIYEFIANHPFIFFIHDKHTDLTLFLGRLVKPKGGVVHHEEL